jgi:shikimate kinase
MVEVITMHAPADQRILYMLIGPKGAGKTHIGSLVDRYTDIKFLRVESVWLGLKPGEDGWIKVEAAIDRLFQTHDKVMIESLGVGEGFQKFYSSLMKKYSIRMIHVYAELDTCLERVQNRSKQDHIAVSDEKVIEYNQVANTVTYKWDLEIDNNHPLADAEILGVIRSIGTE